MVKEMISLGFEKIQPVFMLPGKLINKSLKDCTIIHFYYYQTPLTLKFYQELLKENSNPRLKGNRKGIIVKGKEFYIPILNTFPTR